MNYIVYMFIVFAGSLTCHTTQALLQAVFCFALLKPRLLTAKTGLSIKRPSLLHFTL